MCFTIPKKIETISGSHATIEGGVTIDISGIDTPVVGDYVFITSGIAIQKLSPDEALTTRSTIKQTYSEIKE